MQFDDSLGEFTPVAEFSQLVIKRSAEVERWFRSQFLQTPPPFYSSMDIRNSGYQICAIDSNLFPAGFNNLHQSSKSLAVQAITSSLGDHCPNAMRVIIIPENHTRNQFYLSNLWHLQKLLLTAGVEVRIASLDENITEKTKVQIESPFIKKIVKADGANQTSQDKQLTNEANDEEDYFLEYYPLKRKDNKLYCEIESAENPREKFYPCMVLLNNDLSAGFPEILQNIEMPINPPPELGWHSRLKSEHFFHYQQVCTEFTEYFNVPNKVLCCKFATVDNIDFQDKDSLIPLISECEKLFAILQEKYQATGNPHKPYLVIKADAGTYGMAVMAINSIEEIKNLNRKARNKLSVGKDGMQTRRILIQEGIHSIENINNHSAEEVLYLIGNCAAGGFYRIHPDKENNGILNSPGMHFQDIPFTNCCNYPDNALPHNHKNNRHYVSGVIARLAALACAREIEAINKK